MPLWCFLLLLGSLVCSSNGFDPAAYPMSQQLLPRYTVFWRVDEAKQILHLALKVQTTGWVGFGIAEVSSGSMPGSDIVIGTVKNGVGSITDRWASSFALPVEDDCQDWVLVAAEEKDGFTILEILRSLDTKDTQDRAIVYGGNRIIAAFGEQDGIGYHEGNRITSEIIFYGKPDIVPLTSDAMSIDLLVANYTVSDGDTHYVCQSFALPDDKQYHVIRIEPIIEPSSLPHIHHFLIHICENKTDGYVPAFQNPGECMSPLGDTTTGCSSLMGGWAAGGGPIYLPAAAGFSIGNAPNAARFVILEIHYNNPDGVGGYTDQSGIRMWYTPELRQYEAGVITFGDPWVQYGVIPAHNVTEYEAECPGACTSQFPHEITVFQSFPHMHQVGREIWTTHWRNETQIGTWGKVEYWSFDQQLSEIVNITIKPGDRLNTHCVYDTLKKSTPTPFGPSSYEEMCMHFVSYYPRIMVSEEESFSYCGYLNDDITLCGGADTGYLPYANPTIFDPIGAMNRTFGAEGSVCRAPPTAPGSSTTSATTTGTAISSCPPVRTGNIAWASFLIAMFAFAF